MLLQMAILASHGAHNFLIAILIIQVIIHMMIWKQTIVEILKVIVPDHGVTQPAHLEHGDIVT